MTRDELIGVLRDACGPDTEVVVGAAGAMLGLRAVEVRDRETMSESRIGPGGTNVVQVVVALDRPVPLAPG